MQRAYGFFGKSINLNRHALLDTHASYLYIFVGHRVMVGLNIFVGDNTMRQLLSNGSISRLKNGSVINCLCGKQINYVFIEGNGVKAYYLKVYGMAT